MAADLEVRRVAEPAARMPEPHLEVVELAARLPAAREAVELAVRVPEACLEVVAQPVRPEAVACHAPWAFPNCRATLGRLGANVR